MFTSPNGKAVGLVMATLFDLGKFDQSGLPSLKGACPLLKGRYTGHEKTYTGDVNISLGLAKTKRNQQISEKIRLTNFSGQLTLFPKFTLKLGIFGTFCTKP